MNEAWDYYYSAFESKNLYELIMAYSENSTLESVDHQTNQRTSFHGINEIKSYHNSFFDNQLQVMHFLRVEFPFKSFCYVYYLLFQF